MKTALVVNCVFLAAAIVTEAVPTVTPGEPRNGEEKKEERFAFPWWLVSTPGTTKSFCDIIEPACTVTGFTNGGRPSYCDSFSFMCPNHG